MVELSVPILKGGPFYRAPATVATTLAIRQSDDEAPRKVTKVVGYADGGLALLAPYHRTRSGVVTKTLIDYRAETHKVHLERTDLFSAGDRVKLSYHPDGFVQFSGERPGRIVSGRDELTGEPKGLGIMANPMNAPVMTGPAFGITLWGLEDFVVQQGRPRGDLIVFAESDFVYDHCDESSWGCYSIEFFIFTMYFQPYVRQVSRINFEMPLWLNQWHGGEGHAFNLKVVRLGHQPWFLGAVVLRRPPVQFEAPSGWSIGSPGALTRGPIKPALHAHYPADGWPEGEHSLDYVGPVDWSQVPFFARDHVRMMQQAEANLRHQASSQIPQLALLNDAIRVLAGILDHTLLTRADLESHAGQVRIALATLAVLGGRATRAVALLIAPGYVPEASVMVARLTSACEIASIIDEGDSDANAAERFLEGAGLNELEPETWESVAEDLAASVDQLPGLAIVRSPMAPRPGISFSGPRELERAKELARDAAILATRLALICAKNLLGDEVPDLLGKRIAILHQDLLEQAQATQEAGEQHQSPSAMTTRVRRANPAIGADAQSAVTALETPAKKGRSALPGSDLTAGRRPRD